MKNLKILFIVGILAIIVNACGKETVSDPIALKELPTELKEIQLNNSKIPSFKCKFSMSSTSEGNRVSADGYALVDKNQKRIKILMVDTLTEEVLLDLALLNDRITIFLYNTKGGIIIKGRFGSLDLGRYIKNFKIDLKDLIDLISGKSYLFDQIDDMKMQESKTYRYYKLQHKNKTEILSVLKETKRLNELVLMEDNKEIFRVFYKKYIDEKKFYFPKRSDFYHKKTGSKNIVYVTETEFNQQFSDKLFAINNYPGAKVIDETQ